MDARNLIQVCDAIIPICNTQSIVEGRFLSDLFKLRCLIQSLKVSELPDDFIPIFVFLCTVVHRKIFIMNEDAQQIATHLHNEVETLSTNLEKKIESKLNSKKSILSSLSNDSSFLVSTLLNRLAWNPRFNGMRALLKHFESNVFHSNPAAASSSSSNVNSEKLQLAWEKYKVFMPLAASFGNVAPSKDIDFIWHLHMLEPHNYLLDCLDLNPNILIDHNRSSVPSQNLYRFTSDLWSRFGSMYFSILDLFPLDFSLYNESELSFFLYQDSGPCWASGVPISSILNSIDAPPDLSCFSKSYRLFWKQVTESDSLEIISPAEMDEVSSDWKIHMQSPVFYLRSCLVSFHNQILFPDVDRQPRLANISSILAFQKLQQVSIPSKAMFLPNRTQKTKRTKTRKQKNVDPQAQPTDLLNLTSDLPKIPTNLPKIPSKLQTPQTDQDPSDSRHKWSLFRWFLRSKIKKHEPSERLITTDHD